MLRPIEAHEVQPARSSEPETRIHIATVVFFLRATALPVAASAKNEIKRNSVPSGFTPA